MKKRHALLGAIAIFLVAMISLLSAEWWQAQLAPAGQPGAIASGDQEAASVKVSAPGPMLRTEDIDCSAAEPGPGNRGAKKLIDCVSKSSAKGTRKLSPKTAPEMYARQVLKDAASVLGIKKDTRDLELASARYSKNVSHVRFSQTYKGVPVYGAQVAVHSNIKNGKVMLVDSDYVGGITLADVRPKLKSVTAIRKAVSQFGDGAKKWQDPKAQLVIYPAGGQVAVLAWRTIVPLARPLGVWEVIVDAATGSIINRRNLALFHCGGPHECGEGRIFDPNPVVSSGIGALADNNDQDPSFSLNNQRELRTFQELDPRYLFDVDGDGVRESQVLKGFYASAVGPGRRIDSSLGIVSEAAEPVSPLRLRQTCNAGPCFSYLRSDDRFEEANAYYHITESQLYLQSIGFTTPDAAIRSRVTTASVNFSIGGTQFWNAFYIPPRLPGIVGQDELFFGSLGVDAAEDADVINHELGHAIQTDQLLNGPTLVGTNDAGASGPVTTGDALVFPLGNEAAAIAEAFGDYFAFTRHSEPGDAIGPYGQECIGAWFIRTIPDVKCIRRTDSSRSYPGGMVWEGHEDGEIWLRALVDIWKSLGQQTADRIIINSNFYLNPDATFSDGVNAILISDRELNPPSGAYQSEIVDVFAARGIYPSPCSAPWARVILTSGQTGAPPYQRPCRIQVPSAVTSGSPLSIDWDNMGTSTAAYQLEYTENATGDGTWNEGFEDGWVSPVDFSLGSPAWKAAAKWSKSGLFSARSATIGDGGFSQLSKTIDVPDRASVEFDYRVYSEAMTGLKQGDNLFFFACGPINGPEEISLESPRCIQLGLWSGKKEGHFKIQTLEAGRWFLSWVYFKDGSKSSGADAAWIDNVKISGINAPAWKPLAALLPSGTETYLWSSPMTPSFSSATVGSYQLRLRGLAGATQTPWTYSNLFRVDPP